MRLNFLRKILFPHQTPWQQKKQMKILFWVVLVAVIFAAIMGAFMLFMNSRNPR